MFTKFYRNTAISAFNRIVQRLTRIGYNMTSVTNLVQESENTYTQSYKVKSYRDNLTAKTFTISDDAPHLDIKISSFDSAPGNPYLNFNLHAKIEGTSFDWEGEDNSLLVLVDVFTEDMSDNYDIISAYVDTDYISKVTDDNDMIKLSEAYEDIFSPFGEKVYDYGKYFFDANMKMKFMDQLITDTQNLFLNAGLFATKEEQTKGHAKYKITGYNTENRKMNKLTDTVEFIIDQDYDMYDQSNGKVDITVKAVLNGKDIVNLKDTFDMTDRKDALTKNKNLINSAIDSMIDQLSKANIIKDHARLRISENKYATCSNVAKNITNHVYEKLNRYFFNHVSEDMDNNSMHSMIDDVNDKIDIIMDALGLDDSDDEEDSENNVTKDSVTVDTDTEEDSVITTNAPDNAPPIEIESDSVTPVKLATETKDKSLQDVIMNLRNNNSTTEES